MASRRGEHAEQSHRFEGRVGETVEVLLPTGEWVSVGRASFLFRQTVRLPRVGEAFSSHLNLHLQKAKITDGGEKYYLESNIGEIVRQFMLQLSGMNRHVLHYLDLLSGGANLSDGIPVSGRLRAAPDRDLAASERRALAAIQKDHENGLLDIEGATQTARPEYEARPDKNETAIAFLRRIYEAELRDGTLTLSDLRKSDGKLWAGLRNWANHSGTDIETVIPKGRSPGRPRKDEGIDPATLDPSDPRDALALETLRRRALDREKARRTRERQLGKNNPG